ncbi:MAG: respiratory nitrate reductase subunit gamma [Candidatus Paceibacterota bacterium]|jgi:nitrate reductase gamma subunit|nr:respiratory nitrate reductase subunit gamma [Candidatus Paceibacterota bacterium]
MNYFLFGIYPYIALAICIVGCRYRYRHYPESWKASSDMFLETDRLHRLSLRILHWGIFLLLGGHVVGLLTPHEIYEPFISIAHKQMLAMVGGGVFGGMVLVGLSLLLFRRIYFLRVRRTSVPMDYVVLVSLLLSVMTGLATIPVSAGHPHGDVMIALSSWAQNIVTFQPGAADLVAGVPLIYKIHIFIGMTTLFTLLPFGRLIHAISGVAAIAVYPFRPWQVVRLLRWRK